MQKALFWMLMGFILFAILVGGIFGYLTHIEKDPEEIAATEEKMNTLPDIISKAQRDSLINLLQDKDSVITVREGKRDSLQQVVTSQKTTITEQKERIQELQDQLVEKEDRAANIKNLAKTYESLRVAEMGPILKDIGDTTLIDIYNQMSSRKRKNLLQALPPNRAARITNKLAGSNSKDAG